MTIGKRDFHYFPKVVVGEGASDCNFLLKFCQKHKLDKFQFVHTSLFPDSPGGWEHFDKVFQSLPTLPRYEEVTDIAVFCDTGENPATRYEQLKTRVEAVTAVGPEGAVRFKFTAPNVVVTTGMPRLHVFMVPKVDGKGGLETLCLEAAAGEFGDAEKATMEAVDEFATKVCRLGNGDPWTVEKTDKLRLHAFVAATSPRRPGVHFYRQLSMNDGTIPLSSNVFDGIKTFLSDIAAL